MNVSNIMSLSAYKLLMDNSNAYLIDVRTKAEHVQTGVPKIDNKMYLISWRFAPDMIINQSFEKEFSHHLGNFNEHSIVLFICRSGGRSYEAADFITKTTPVKCYNIIDGFEGSSWGAGWKSNNLPWQIVA